MFGSRTAYSLASGTPSGGEYDHTRSTYGSLRQGHPSGGIYVKAPALLHDTSVRVDP